MAGWLNRLRLKLGLKHKHRWVSGPGGGNEEVVCDYCGVELTEGEADVLRQWSGM